MSVSAKQFPELLSSANQIHRARLYATASPYTATWAYALPSPKLGFHLDKETVRRSVAQCLGAKI